LWVSIIDLWRMKKIIFCLKINLIIRLISKNHFNLFEDSPAYNIHKNYPWHNKKTVKSQVMLLSNNFSINYVLSFQLCSYFIFWSVKLLLIVHEQRDWTYYSESNNKIFDIFLTFVLFFFFLTKKDDWRCVHENRGGNYRVGWFISARLT
jgi:hypothetical protein